MANSTTDAGLPPAKKSALRQRVCGQCYSVFWICPHCDRGQRYCNLTCRTQARRAQRRRANRCHQQSREGREDHRDRQREYRRRCRLRSGVVTDKGSVSLASPGRMPSCEARTAQTAFQVGLSAFHLDFPTVLCFSKSETAPGSPWDSSPKCFVSIRRPTFLSCPPLSSPGWNNRCCRIAKWYTRPPSLRRA
jgi:hypothetical protein